MSMEQNPDTGIFNASEQDNLSHLAHLPAGQNNNPSYRDIYYEQFSSISKSAEVDQAKTDDPNVFITETEKQYAYLVATYPDQADIYIEYAHKIQRQHPNMMSTIAYNGLLAIKDAAKQRTDKKA